ncbi:cadmium resistance transporter [Asanoa siamensis]|uniref:Cadmium transporter n=1 Tax=Asanoa siamensis TaxID=926357 RepID=A0ABQ4CRD0_9ACTN|nr:cadmium resistance transporter [Asanoa siamensis]GIF73835.1 cadmium transporter [Asanoa siamensis]
MDLVGTVAAAAGLFAGTNVDDLVVLTVLFLAARTTGLPRPWQIWLGQYAGIATLVAIAGAAALGLTLLPDRWVGLLGLVPLALGVRGLVAAFRSDGTAAPPVASGLVSVAAVTIANGADNIAVYTPVFRAIGLADTLLTIGVFAVLTAVWCLAGAWLGGHRRVIDVLGRWGHWLVPLVFVAIGLVILGGLL